MALAVWLRLCTIPYVNIDTSVQEALTMAVIGAILGVLWNINQSSAQRSAFAGKKQAGDSTATHQQRTVEIDLPYTDAFHLALEALYTLDKQPIPAGLSQEDAENPLIQGYLKYVGSPLQFLRLHRNDPTNGVIEAGLRKRLILMMDWEDFSRISLRLEKVDAATTRIHIDSQAKTVFETYDLGKNLHYVNQLALYLRRESQPEDAARLSENDALEADADAEIPDVKRRVQ